ncbi:AAA family ATPase [Bacillus sp. M6-12]|uniref:AAA family ATPase n=1 Tax=Bacillus sp. M6-12 TaxID=2054166 RepID=UPI0015E1496B|nr:AAA family ATPase [Bacillus sp. M6-12]
MLEVGKQAGGGYNFGITNHKENALEEIPLNTSLNKKIMIEKQFTYNEESGYGIYQGEDENSHIIKVSGVFPSALNLGSTYEMKGKVISFRGEKQFSVESAKATRPVTKNGIVGYLQNLDGLFKKAEFLYEQYGDKVIDLLAEDPMKIAKEIDGIGKTSVLKWQEQIQKMEDSQDYFNKLLEYGLNLRQAKKLFEKYKQGAVEKIQDNPYLLVEEFPSFGFEKADRIAKQMGYDPKGMFRIQEGLKYVLKEASSEGHCFLPMQELLERTIEVLVIRLTEEEMIQLLEDFHGQRVAIYQVGEHQFPLSYDSLSKQFKQYRYETNRFEREKKRMVAIRLTRDEILKELEFMELNNKLVMDNYNIYLPELYEAEFRVANKVISLSKSAKEDFAGAEEDLSNLLIQENMELEEKQKEAVLEFTRGQGGFYILNGSAGCGKTFTLNVILRVLGMQFQKMKRMMEVKVLAPTGKASKVAGKATGRPCMTIHRGLKYKPATGFEHNENNPIDADVIVVDESSMLDILLADGLLSAIADGTKVIFLGDTKQLPSVGAGNVLQDLIDSNLVKMVTLNVVKRQGKDSGIIRNANRIINGEMISSCKDTQDAYVLRKETMLEAQLALLKSIREVQKVKQYDVEDIQVLCPQKNSLVGTNAMNYLIQQEFNPGNEDMKILNKKFMAYNHVSEKEELVTLFFKRGDKVIHMRNNYEMIWYIKGKFGNFTQDYDMVGITNGESGLIEDIIKGKASDNFKTRMIVRYEDRYAFYDDQFDELEHAYALTIHKSQGSQWKAVIIPIMMQNYHMLDNNLFYTGYTRAQAFCVVVGQADAILHAIRSHKTKERYTTLKERIIEFNEG